MKNRNDQIGILTLDLPACSAVPHPTAPLPTPNPTTTRVGRIGKCNIRYRMLELILWIALIIFSHFCCAWTLFTQSTRKRSMILT